MTMTWHFVMDDTGDGPINGIISIQILISFWKVGTCICMLFMNKNRYSIGLYLMVLIYLNPQISLISLLSYLDIHSTPDMPAILDKPETLNTLYIFNLPAILNTSRYPCFPWYYFISLISKTLLIKLESLGSFMWFLSLISTVIGFSYVIWIPGILDILNFYWIVNIHDSFVFQIYSLISLISLVSTIWFIYLKFFISQLSFKLLKNYGAVSNSHKTTPPGVK